MTRTAASNTSAAFLARLLHGLDMTSPDLDEPNFSADEVEADGSKLSVRLFTPSGDTYQLTVEWLSSESP